MKNLIALIKGLFTRKDKVDTIPSAVPQAQPVDSALAALPVTPVAPAETTDTDKLKAILIALGHDVADEWNRAVSLAKKIV